MIIARLLYKNFNKMSKISFPCQIIQKGFERRENIIIGFSVKNKILLQDIKSEKHFIYYLQQMSHHLHAISFTNNDMYFHIQFCS